MTYQGTVQNGVVVLHGSAPLPEVAIVTVSLGPAPDAPTPVSPDQAGGDLDPIFRLDELAVDTGIPDLGLNIDHYLYGHPKVDDAP